MSIRLIEVKFLVVLVVASVPYSQHLDGRYRMIMFVTSFENLHSTFSCQAEL